MGQFRILNSIMETRNHSKNGASLKSQMSRVNQSLSVKGTDTKQNIFMNMLRFCIVLILMCVFCENTFAQVKEKTQTQTFVREKKPPFIVHGNYKDSYSISFMCRVEVAVHGGWEALIKGCDEGSYSDGYEDGYNGKEEKYAGAMWFKTFIKGMLVASAYLSNTTPEEATPLTNSATKLSVKELSYKNGYSDGQKDRRKEEAEIAEGQKQGREIIYAGRNPKFKEMFKK